MANINSGAPIRFENGGILQLGSTPDTVLNLVAGTMEIDIPGREVIQHKDRGQLQSSALVPGDQRPCMIRFNVFYAPNQLAGGAFRQLVKQSITTGIVNTFQVIVKVPDYDGAATGDKYVFAKCFLADGEKIKMSSGQNFDHMELEMTDFEADPTPVRY